MRHSGAIFVIAFLLAVASTAPGVSEEPPNPLTSDERYRALAEEISPAGAAPAVDEDLFAGAETLDRRQLVEAVLARNPTIEAARQAFAASLERYPQAIALDDPMLSYGMGPLSPFDSDVRYGQVLEVSQRVPYPGKLRLAGEAALAAAEAGRAEIETVRLDLALAASRLYDELYRIDRALEINAEHVRLLEDFQRVATARYAAGLAPQASPLAAEVELAHLNHRTMVLGTARRVAEARINALLHRRPGLLLPPVPERLTVSPEPPAELASHNLSAPAEASSEALEERALATRPELAASTSEIESLEAMVTLAGLRSKPDFAFSTSYNSMWNDLSHRWMVGVSVNLPIRKAPIRAAEAEAEARLAAARARRQSLEDAIRAEVRQAYDLWAESHHVLDLYSSRLLPAARDQVRAARVAFESSQASFLTLIEAEKNLRSVELAYQELVAEASRRRAELARAVGAVAGLWSAPAAAATIVRTPSGVTP